MVESKQLKDEYLHIEHNRKQDAVLSQGVPRDAAVNFGTYQSFHRHQAVFTAITKLSN